MMDRHDNHSAVICKFCGEAYCLPDDEAEGNLPRVLLCGHIYCTSCLQSIECGSVVTCPDCEVETAIPAGGVDGLQEDSRIIGLIYTAKTNKTKSLRWDRSRNRRRNQLSPSADINANTEDLAQSADIEKIEKTVDEALAQGAENLAQLEHVHKTMTTGLAEQVKRDRARLETEVKQAADKAVHTVQKWVDMQLNQLTKLEAPLSSRAKVHAVLERIRDVEIGMQMAREIRRVPSLGQYCALDKILMMLQAPVDKKSYMDCITVGSGMSCVFQSEDLSQSLSVSLKMEVSKPKQLCESSPKGHQPGSSPRNTQWQREGRNANRFLLSRNKLPTTPKRAREGQRARSLSLRGSPKSPSPCRRSIFSHHSLTSDPESPDVIFEELLDDGQSQGDPPTGPELANDKWRMYRMRKDTKGRKNLFEKRNVQAAQWVVVSHIVNPSHFYVRFLAEKRENDNLSKKINHLCCSEDFHFTARDTVKTDSMIFVKWKGLWCRASVIEVLQTGCVEAVKLCPVNQLASIRVFLPDYGLTKSFTIQSEGGSTESSLRAVNNQLRKVDEVVNAELRLIAPQAIRCSLKDLVPYDLIKGWSEEARAEFQSIVGSAAVEMRPLDQDRDCLLVDLRKSPMNQSSNMTVSVREHLVFIEVARFYSPVTLGKRPLLYYPPVYPKINTELNAVVSHINNPADFYIQLADNTESLLLAAKLQVSYDGTRGTGEEDLNVYCPVIGQACVARYHESWYRAQVTGHPGGRKVEVYYVDFGNKRILSVSDLRKIKDEFFALPSMAIPCCLVDLIPLDGKTWSDACINRFISLTHQKLVTIVATGNVFKAAPLPIKLFESGLDGPVANIADLLVQEELACLKEGLKSKDENPPDDELASWDPPLELGLATEGSYILDQEDLSLQEAPLDFESQLKLSCKLKDLKVKVSHVNSPSSFYVQLTQYESQLKRVCELVKLACAHMEPQDVMWKADMYCAAHINGVWERGQIVSDIPSSNIAEMIRCDHGNTVKVHISNLQPLPAHLRGSLALECSLTGIRPAGGRCTWTATACELISHYLIGASAVMTIKELTDRPAPVTLACSINTGQLVSVADFLVSEGLALRHRKPSDAVMQTTEETNAQSPVGETQTDVDRKMTHPCLSRIPFPVPSSTITSPIRPKPTPRSIVSAEKVNTQLYRPPELPGLGHIQIIVTAIGEAGIIYVRTQNAESQLKQLRERIQQSMKTLPTQKPYTWKSVQGCAVIGPDMLWYRGQLLEVLGGHIKVQNVDSGEVENIPVVHVYPMLLCDDVPQLCIPCQLHRINPVGGKWHLDAVALLREVLVNRSVDTQVVELPTDPRGSLTVELFLDGLNLGRILCHHEHASIDCSLTGQAVMPPAPVLDEWDIDTEGLRGPEETMLGAFIYPKLPQEGEHFKVRVKHLVTPNELFLWPLEEVNAVEVKGETLDEALSRVNANISSVPPLTSFPHGALCLAEYSDGVYYRARLIRFTSVEPVMVLVQHVDFGSDDTLPTSKLRQIPAELLRFPSRALKVRVAGFKPPSVNVEGNVLPYSPRWSVKAAMDMMELLHGTISASVVAREPELTVLLYGEDGDLVHLPLVSSGLAEFE